MTKIYYRYLSRELSLLSAKVKYCPKYQSRSPMNRMLFSGSQHHHLETQAFQTAEQIAEDSIGSVLYLTRNDARRSHVADKWAETHKPLQLRTETLDSIVREWYEKLEGPVDRPPGQLDRRLTEYALDRATANEESILACESASASLADAFSSRFSLFDDAGVVTASALETEFNGSELEERIATATVDVYRQYRSLQEELLEEWILTRGEIFETVATADVPLSELTPGIDVVILSGYYEFRPLERAILQRIVDSFDAIAILPLHQAGTGGVDNIATDALELYRTLGFERHETEPTTDLTAITSALYQPDPDPVPNTEALQWRELPTPEREVRYVARELRNELTTGRDTDDLAIIVPGLRSYAEYISDTFETFEIPYVTTATAQLDRTYTGNVVHDLLALAEPNPRAEDLTSLLANPLVDLISPEQVATVTAATRRRDTASLHPLLETLDNEITVRIEELLEQLKTLRTGDLDTAIETLRTILDEQLEIDNTVETYAGGTDQELEKRAYALTEEVLESFETMTATSSRLSPLALFTRAFDGVPVRAPQAGVDGQVEVMGMLDARMRSFDKVFIVGLTTEHFPTIPERPAFFDEMTDAHPRFDTGDERLRGRYLFATLLANVTEATLTTPKTGNDDSAVVRSPILDELQRVTGIEPIEGVDDRVGSREDLQRHIADCSDKRVAVDYAGNHGDFSPSQTKRTDRGLVCADRRASTELTPYDGVLDAETVNEVYPPSEREPYSASRLERYAECGFKFYAENVLDIEDPDDVEVTPTPLETGSYVHDVLERFYVDLQSSGDEIDLGEYDRDELEQHLLDVALEELADAEFAYDGLFYERWAAKLFAGLGDEESNPYTTTDVPHDAPERGLFVAFLEEELSRRTDDRPSLFEAPFGSGLPDSDSGPFEVDCGDGATVSIRGYIDRLDVAHSEDRSELTLYDYKTGRTPAMTKTTGGTKFQLPIYLLAADHIVDSDRLANADLAATYYQVRPPNDIHVPRGIESKFDSQTELRQFLDMVVPSWLGQLDDAIANGRFHTTLLASRDANCKYCEYRRSCDVRHHRKREHLETAREDERAYVPLRAQDDVDVEKVMADD
jgi:ATP-dependent helicase/nuclease subunit B